MKNKYIKKILAMLCVCSMAVSVMPVQAAKQEYTCNTSKSDLGFSIIAPGEGFTLSEDYYVYGKSLYYTAHREEASNKDDWERPSTVNFYRASLDGSDPEVIGSAIVEGFEGKINLVTENYVYVPYGYAYIDKTIILDKRTGKTEIKDAYVVIGQSDNDYKKSRIPTPHVKEYYAMMRSHSDVSPQKIIVFNGKNAKQTVVCKKGLSAKFFKDKLYYIAENKDGLYLGCCMYNGKNNARLARLDVPKNCFYATIASIDKNKITYKCLTNKGTKKLTYKF